MRPSDLAINATIGIAACAAIVLVGGIASELWSQGYTDASWSLIALAAYAALAGPLAWMLADDPEVRPAAVPEPAAEAAHNPLLSDPTYAEILAKRDRAIKSKKRHSHYQAALAARLEELLVPQEMRGAR